jgi:hypothetical protein
MECSPGAEPALKVDGDFSDLNNIDLLAERIAQAVRTKIYGFFEKNT